MKIAGKPEEFAALVRELQERRIRDVGVHFTESINNLAKILRAKDDTTQEAPEKPSN